MCTTKCQFDAISLVRKYDAYATTYERLPLKMAPNILRRLGRTAATAVREAMGGGRAETYEGPI